ncbi:transcription termination factor 3, mitochondrial-like [Argopecten irradians]|uniref:transcription termination factor 3, mitochondrial-like n=1 Tax=Argopecten irradians TaxID=31199 RepID=UPI003715CA2C
MATCRTSFQLSGGFRNIYRRSRSTNFCDLCWKRSVCNGTSSQVNGRGISSSTSNTSNVSVHITKGRYNRQSLLVTALCVNRTLKTCVVRSTKSSILGTQIKETPVIWFQNLSSPNLMLFSSRHFCSDKFQTADTTGKIQQQLNERADSSSLDKSVAMASPDSSSNRGDQQVISNHGDQQVISHVQDYVPIDQESRLPSRYLPKVPKTIQSYNLAPFVAKSEVLRYLVQLNVNLAKVEEKSEAASSLVKLDIEKDVMPVMAFMKEADVPDDKLGKVIGLHPFIFERFDKAQLIVEYFKSMKFTKESISRIIVGAPPILGMDVVQVDMRIGMYHKFFKLTGDQTRDVFTRVPRIILNRSSDLKETIELFKGFGFSNSQLRSILLQCPSVFKRPEEDNLKFRLEYLILNIPMDVDTITKFSYILRYPSYPIKERHLFLLELGRAQYDPTKENYISPTDLVCTPEPKFCKLARTTPKIFKEFKMTL